MSEKSDASTTTDDMQMPPLCLFYFSHPFGILSPDPPKVSNATDVCFQQPWMQRIQAQPWPFPGGNPPHHERNQENRQPAPQQSRKFHYSPSLNMRASLKVKKGKILNQKRYATKVTLDKEEHNVRICNKCVNTDDNIKTDECKTIGSEEETKYEADHSRSFDKNKLECRNLTCCGETHLFSKGRSLIRPKKHANKIIDEYGNKQHQKNILPPIERPTKICGEDSTYKRWLDVDHQRNNFRLKAFLPPIELENFETLVSKPSGEMKADENIAVNQGYDEELYPNSNIEINVETVDDGEVEIDRGERRKKKVRRKRRPVKSSGGVNKARSRPHRSAARKLVNCLLQSVNTERRAPTATLPALSEVLSTVREAWTSPKSLMQRDNSSIPMNSSPAKQPIVMLDSKEKCAAKAGASPGLLRRRYSVPETVMRKYKLAQIKSDTDDSDACSAPSPPRGYSPARRIGNSSNQGSKGFLGSIRPSPLLRRLWGRQGGSHSELRYWDSCSVSNTCEACKKSEKNVSAVKPEPGLPPSPVHKMYRTSRSPKKINPYCGQGFSPERYITHLENTRDMLMRETKVQLTSPKKYKTGGSAPSERSSFKSTSVSEGSPKLGLSSLATSSYPVTDGNSVSDVTSEVTRSSTSYSSDDVSHARYKIPLNRPMTTEYSSRNETSQNTSEVTKKRRQTVCIYMNTLNSPTVEIKSSTITPESSSHPTTQESLKLSESNISNTETYSTPTSKDYEMTESLQIIDDSNTSDKTLITTSSSAFDKSSFGHTSLDSDATPIPYTTSTSGTTGTSETKTTDTVHTTETSATSRTTTLTTTHDDSSRNDSALSTRTSLTTDDPHGAKSPESDEYDKGDKNNKADESSKQIYNVVDLSDTGISLNDDTNRNSFNSGTSDPVLSKPGSASKSDSSTVVSDIVTCLENTGLSKRGTHVLKNTKLECIEVVVSETLNSSAFDENNKDKPHSVTDKKQTNEVSKQKRKDATKTLCTPNDIDQYVSSILIDSLNSMTDQINEINSNSEEDIKLNILEKEIKVKLQNLCASPINLPTNTMISSFITNIPDDELLETTIIEEKSHTLAYTTESQLFPIESSAEGAGIPRELIKSENTPSQTMESPECDEFDGQSESSPEFETLTFRTTELDNNNYSDVLKGHKDTSNENDSLHFYLNDLNENANDPEITKDKAAKKAVLDKLNRMFESSQSVDTNFNICIDTPTNNYFCGSVYRDVSHLEMSTDVDVFVDNSLNKMINSIDLCTDAQDLSLENGNEKSQNVFQPVTHETVNNNFLDKHDAKTVKRRQNVNSEGKKIISNIGSGCLYQKPPQKPLVVPRFSAVPNTESMEVNTSSDDEVSSCESDCLSLIDSLDDQNSPRLLELTNIRKASKHDKTPVRGGIIAMLPENVTSHKSPIKEKSETFFIPIKDDENECIKESVIVAEHMPEKLKEKLIRRQQKRELRREHRKKKMKLFKRESEIPKETESKKSVSHHEAGNVEFFRSTVVQEIEKAQCDEKKKSSHISKGNEPSKRTSKKDISSKKEEKQTKEFRSFVIDKRGDIKMTITNKSPEKETKRDLRCNGLKSKSDSQNLKHHIQENDPYNTKKYDIQEPRYNPNLSGPRRLYQKTEFKEGNKHVEILEIVECVDSSPEPNIYEYYENDHGKENASGKKSKIPIPVLEKLHKTSKRLPSTKLLKRCRSPITKSLPFNILVARSDQNHNKNGNTKVDQIIANILIDAINEDSLVNRKFQVTSPLHDKKPMHPVVKKLVSSELSSKKFMSQPNIDKAAVLPKFKQQFDVIPEERSSVSIDSQSEDNNKNRKQSSSTGDVSDQTTASSTKRSESKTTSQDTCKDANENQFKSNHSSNEKKHEPRKTVDVEVQGNILRKIVECHDVSTSPLPQFVSAATSPILLEHIDKKPSAAEVKKKQITGKKALTTKEGWAVFCKSQRVCSPEQEGSHPSFNIPSDREAIEKISEDYQTSDSTTAPHSQRVLRRVDSKNNIKQININHKPPRPEKKSSSNHKDVLKDHNNKDKVNKVETERHKTRYNKPEISAEESTETIKATKKSFREHSDEENRNEILKVKHKSKAYDIIDKRENKNSDESKKMLLPSPFANQSYSRSSDSSSGSDSEAVACPTLIPRWLPNSNNFRQRRIINRRTQRRDELYKPPYQNGSGGWSVTLAGSCYTTLPSDVEMKVIFPKGNQQATSQSDSGLGEESRPTRKQTSVDCKKCSSALQSCKCLSAVRRQDPTECEREHFLPPTLGRKSTKGSGIGHSGSLDQLSTHSKKYDYLPDVNLTSGNKNRSRKPSIQMDRRFSLHCWLPEDKPHRGQKIAKVQISESIGHPDGDELSVFGCAIMPEVKPRVPTMSERDLTRIHAAQYYSRTRRC